jgi:hypothetical protein
MSLPLILEAVSNATTTATTTPVQLDPASAATNATSTPGLVPTLQGWVSSFAVNASAVTLTMDNAAIDIGKAAVVFLVIAGVVLWFTHVNKHLGKELLEGGIVIGLFIEFGVPVLMSIHLP